ncbi:glypican-5-like [Branchiostoma floridae]|uniref:Glypican-5-like n=1 Tax=Branchiostoma floridae TaxID=7739 RepID=A0A9J7N425_BRAFL|nr:glypican-5-like [Branchiostoma floridae]
MACVGLLVTVLAASFVGGTLSQVQDDAAVVPTCREVQQAWVYKSLGPKDLVPTAPRIGHDLAVCSKGKTCCTKRMEDKYLEASKKDFQDVVQSTSAYLKYLVSQNAARFQEQFHGLIQKSENETHHLFRNVYKNMAIEANSLIEGFHRKLSFYVNGAELSVTDSVKDFFDTLFPLVYRRLLNPKMTDMSADYTNCVMDLQREVLPFGELPTKISTQLQRSLSAARVFVQALNLGVEVVNTTNHLVLTRDCTKALLKFKYCSHCQGKPLIKPCGNYCMNVMRGCLASVTDINPHWNSYIDVMQSLTKGMKGMYSVETIMATLPDKVSESIMIAMQNGPSLTAKVQKACRRPRQRNRRASQPVLTGGVRRANKPPANLYEHIQTFVRHLAMSKGFYSNLAETICNDDSLAVRPGEEETCWNGLSYGRYTIPVVDNGFQAQRFNPELRVDKEDATIVNIIDKLKHIKELIVSKMAMWVEDPDWDDSGGSGDGPFGDGEYSGDSDDEDYQDSSGSGDGETPAVTDTGSKNEEEMYFEDSTPKQKAAAPGDSRVETINDVDRQNADPNVLNTESSSTAPAATVSLVAMATFIVTAYLRHTL